MIDMLNLWTIRDKYLEAKISSASLTFNDPAKELAFLKDAWPGIVARAQVGVGILVGLMTVRFFIEAFTFGLDTVPYDVLAVRLFVIITGGILLLRARSSVPGGGDFPLPVTLMAIGFALYQVVMVRSGALDPFMSNLLSAFLMLFFTIFIPGSFIQGLRRQFILAIGSIVAGVTVSTATMMYGVPIMSLVLMASVANLRDRAIWMRSAFEHETIAKAATAEIEKHFEQVSHERSAVETQAEKSVVLAEEMHFLREDAENTARDLDAILQNIDQGVLVFDQEFHLVRWNKNILEITDIPEELLVEGTSVLEIMNWTKKEDRYDTETLETIEMAESDIAAGTPKQDRRKFSYERGTASGAWLSVSSNPMPDGGVVVTYSDISERKKAEEKMRKMALYDGLTGLANRTRFEDRLSDALSVAERRGYSVGLLMLDLDNFKPVNDTYGHPVGDALLKKVAETLNVGMRTVDTVARLGGDEFAIILNGIEVPDNGALIADRIIKDLTRPLEVSGHKLQIGTSIGIGLYPQHAQDLEALVKAADDALYMSKRKGRGCYSFADESADDLPTLVVNR